MSEKKTERRDFCKFAKDVYSNAIDGLIIKRSLNIALENLEKDMLALIKKEVPFDSFILNKNLSKDYKNPETQPHLQVNEKKKKVNLVKETEVYKNIIDQFSDAELIDVNNLNKDD